MRLLCLIVAFATLLLRPAFAEPRVLSDLSYGPDADQAVDVYLPDTLSAQSPVLVMVHGGGWIIGDKTNDRVWEEKQAHWGALGYVFASVNYRMLPDAPVAVQASDVASALKFVQDHAAQWGGDPAQLVLMGHSAGAHLAALIAADRALQAKAGLAPWRGTVLLDSAALDVPSLLAPPDPPRYAVRAFGEDPELWIALSPRHRLSAPSGQFFLICSSQRETSCPEARKFADSVHDTGGAAQVLPVDLSHAEINSTLGSNPITTPAVDSFFHSLSLP